jgi:hypothetical protein
MGEADALVAALLQQLPRRVDIADQPERVRSADRDDIGRAALGPALLGDPRHLGIRVGGAGMQLDPRAEQLVEQQVAAGVVGRVAPGHRIGQHQHAVEAELRRGRRGLAGMVRLRTAGGDDGVGAQRQRVAEQELQLAHLVAAQRQAGAVVALDPELRAAQRFREPRQRLQGRRRVLQAEARQLVQRWHRLRP